MQVFEFENTIENNPFALSTNSLTICYEGSVCDFKYSLCESFPDDNDLTRSLIRKFMFSSISSSYFLDRIRNNPSLSLFVLYFLTEFSTERGITYNFLIDNNFTQEEKDYLDLWCPRFDITIDQIQKWSEMAKKHIAFDKYLSCTRVSTLQYDSPIVRRIQAEPTDFPHGKTDLVIKEYDLMDKYEYVVHELRFHRKFSHPNVLGILDYNFNVERNTITLIMEYKKGAGYLPQTIDQIKEYMKQLLNALVFMRKHLFVHHNLKPDNIIFDEQDHVLKIIDFETCKLGINYDTMGNPRYKAPEKNEIGPLGPSCDMYSAGLILSQMLSCVNDPQASLARDLVKMMTKHSAIERIHPIRALEHDFFKQ